MTPSTDSLRDSVREHYAERARNGDSCCGDSGCCDTGNGLYNVKLLADLPADVTQFSLGCGDPISLAALRPGETVVDLGSGGGLDCFLAARTVGPEGRAIGIDMTDEMLERARASADRLGVSNVEFRQGYLEALPVEDNSADVVISNCVINLSPDKPQVFREVFRILKPGGRVAVSDIVTRGALPESVQRDLVAWGACVAGALDVQDYERGLAEAGFTEVRIVPLAANDAELEAFAAGQVFSASITARKAGNQEIVATLECAAPGGVESRREDIERLSSHIAEVVRIPDGYEYRLIGERAEVRQVAEAFIRAESTCCSFLHFDLLDKDNELILRLTGDEAAITFAERNGLGAGAKLP